MSDGKNLARLALARYHLQQAYDLFEKGSSARYNLEPLMEQLDGVVPNVAELLKIGKTYEEALRSYEYFQELQNICHPEERYETVTLPTGGPYKQVKYTLPSRENLYKKVMIRSQEIKDGKPKCICQKTTNIGKGYGL